MINRVVLTGRLTKNIDLRYTEGGRAVGTFTLAVNRQFTNAKGEREADFVQCVIWNKGSEILSQFAHKGSLIGIDGRIQTRSYDNQQGQRVYVTEVIVENFSLLEPKAKSDENNQNTAAQQETPRNPYRETPADVGTPIDISDDDLPF